MFKNTKAGAQDVINSARVYFAKKSLSMFLFEYMKGKDYSTNVKELDYLMSLIETLELSILIGDVDVRVVGSKVRRIIGPVVATGATQVPPIEIITNEIVFAPDGIYGLGRLFYDENILTESVGCPTGSIFRINVLQAETNEDILRGDEINDLLSGNN